MRKNRLGQSAVEVTELGFGGGPLGGLFAPLDDDTAAGALAASAIYPAPLLGGANGPALALLAAWAAPDLRAARTGSYYEGDLLGAAAIAALLLAMPFATAFSGLSWVAGVLGAAVGLAVGLGLSRLEEPES